MGSPAPWESSYRKTRLMAVTTRALDTNGNDVPLEAVLNAYRTALMWNGLTQGVFHGESDVAFVKAGVGILTLGGGTNYLYGYIEIDGGGLATNGYWDQSPEEYLGGPGPTQAQGEPPGNCWENSIVLAGGQIIGSDTPNGSNGTVIEYRDFFGGSGDVLPPPARRRLPPAATRSAPAAARRLLRSWTRPT